MNLNPGNGYHLLVLGSSSAIPAYGRNLSAYLLQSPSENYLIDCGEGTQFQLLKYKVKLSKINVIFISHLHGDHLYGLPGLLNTMSMQGRNKSLCVLGPKGLRTYLYEIFHLSESHITYPLDIIELEEDTYKGIYKDEQFDVYSIPLEHRLPTCGFLFKQKPELNILTESIKQYGLDHSQIRNLKAGKNISLANGNILKSEEHTYQKSKAKSFAYLSDTIYKPGVVHLIKGVDLLFHEATYENKLEHLALERMHSTSTQAAKIALKCEAKKLLIGHYSSRYSDLEPLLDEARAVFPNSMLAKEGACYAL